MYGLTVRDSYGDELAHRCVDSWGEVESEYFILKRTYPGDDIEIIKYEFDESWFVCDTCFFNHDGVCNNVIPKMFKPTFGRSCSDMLGCHFGSFIPPYLRDPKIPSKYLELEAED